MEQRSSVDSASGVAAAVGASRDARARRFRAAAGLASPELILLANSRDQVAMSRANFEWRVLELGVSVSQASMR